VIADAEGSELVRLARNAVENYVNSRAVVRPERDGKKSGVFVTLNYLAGKEERLRGCIGFPLPERALYQSVVDAAIAAATQDPRFPPVDMKELASIIFEVSVLTPPEAISASPARYREEIRIGRDGLMLRWKYGSGLLLPQVPLELGWDVDEYLANICYKAGAPPDVWLEPSSKLYRFQAEIFKEAEPGGRVIRLVQQYK
jgi:hypothetical protein